MQHRSRNPTSFKLRAVAPLTRADLAYLQQKSARPTIAKLRDSHHIVARLLASGQSLMEVSRASGRSYNSVCSLANSPAMQELVASYRAKENEAWLERRDEFYDLIFSNGLKAQRQISDALDAADDTDAIPIPINRLLAIAADSADRVGYNKRTTSVNVNVDFAARLEAARRASAPLLASSPAEAAE